MFLLPEWISPVTSCMCFWLSVLECLHVKIIWHSFGAQFRFSVPFLSLPFGIACQTVLEVQVRSRIWTLLVVMVPFGTLKYFHIRLRYAARADVLASSFLATSANSSVDVVWGMFEISRRLLLGSLEKAAPTKTPNQCEVGSATWRHGSRIIPLSDYHRNLYTH